MRVLNWLFGVAEEINGGERCPTYLYRWVVLSLPWFKVYLHKFVGDDWSRDFHDHPKRFVSIGLWGWYLEHTPNRMKGSVYLANSYVRVWSAPWIRSFPATHIHRLEVPSPSCWTLVIVGRTVRQWGFWPRGTWVPHNVYLDSTDADLAKGCEG